MGTKWSTVSVSGYNASPPSDDGATTTANEVKWATIKTKLPDPLKTALESVVSKLDAALNFATTAKSGDYTIATTDNGKVIDFTASATATLPAASSAGDSFYVGIFNNHSSSITIARNGSDTISGATSYTLPTKHMLWLFTNDANDGWLASQPVNLIVTGTLSAGSATVTSLSVSDGNITNVGDIALDSISADGTDINLALTDNSATAFTVKEGSTSYLTFVTTNSGEKIVFSKNIEATGDLLVSGEVQTASIGFTDGDNALTIADGGAVTAAAGLVSTAASNTFGATSFNDANISNVGSIAVDSVINDDTNILIDSAGDITLDAGGADVIISDDGTEIGRFTNSSSDLVLQATVQDKDLVFKGDDGGSGITALTLDMSDSGKAIFNSAITSGGVITSSSNLVIANNGNIGSAGDSDSIAIASDGVVTFSQAPVFPNGSINILDLDIDGATDIGAAIADADLFIIDDAAGGTNRKTAASRLKTYIQDAGTVLQVVSASNTSTVNTTSTTFADITSISAAITCQSTSSKVLAMFTSDTLYSLVASTNVTYTVKLLRDSVSLGERSVAAGSGGGGLQARASTSFAVLDSPSSVSELTFKCQHKVSSASSTGSAVSSRLVLMEVAG